MDYSTRRVGGERKTDILAKDAYRILEQTQREEWNNWCVLKAEEWEGLFRGGVENRTGTLVQKQETIKCRHTHRKQNNHNAHIHTKLAGKNGGRNRRGLQSLRIRNGNTTHFIHLHEIHHEG
jgi:hypothetical protein